MKKIIAAPFGRLALIAEDNFLVGIEFIHKDTKLDCLPESGIIHETAMQLQLYFNNPAHLFDLKYKLRGTPFQKQVWEQIALIPCAQTRFYSDIATSIRSAPRAVGGACGRNPLPIIIPCHRVIATKGLGGFKQTHEDNWLLDIKRWLLQHESGLQR